VAKRKKDDGLTGKKQRKSAAPRATKKAIPSIEEVLGGAGDRVRQELLRQTFQAREAYLRRMGVVDDFLLAPLMSPALMGGQAWPAFRQSWRTVRNGDRTIVASDGLSDPFEGEGEANVGFGIEVLGETADPLPDPPQASWLFAVVPAVSQQAAAHGGFRGLIDELGVLSMEMEAPTELQPLATSDGNLGLLLGLRSPGVPFEWELPAGLVKVVTVKVLQPAELAFVIEHGGAGRDRLRELFATEGSYHLSSLFRPPVV
jgi:hypothetical protein